MEQYREVDTRLDVGDSVKICIENLNPHYESDIRWLSHSMRKFNGIETTVSRVIRFGHQRAYELDGITNKQGMPFTWCREALLKLKNISYKEKHNE